MSVPCLHLLRVAGLIAALASCASAIRGIAYDSYKMGDIDAHFATISDRFDTVRTYQTVMGSTNAVNVAAKHELKLYAGLWLRGNGVDFEVDLQAVIDGMISHPNTVQAVLVGNEDLTNNMAAAEVEDYIRKTRVALTKAGFASVKVGSVQTDGDWLAHPELAAACDVVGVNIYPFFGASPQSVSDPIQDLAARWSAVHDQFKDKALLTETGWSFGGGNFGQHIANPENAQAYFAKVQEWTKTSGNGGSNPIYFMFHDHKAKGGYEANFGLADENGVWKFNFDKSTGGNDRPSSTKTPSPSTSSTTTSQPSPGPTKTKSPSPSPAKPNSPSPTSTKTNPPSPSSTKTNAPVPPKPSAVAGPVSFQSPKASNKYLAAANGCVSFQPRGYADKATTWTWSGQLLKNQATGKCLDAYQAKKGGAVHTWPCDEANVNQQWKYDATTKQLKHLTHKGFCLDIATPSGATPYLWECHTQGDPWLAYQQLQAA